MAADPGSRVNGIRAPEKSDIINAAADCLANQLYCNVTRFQHVKMVHFAEVSVKMFENIITKTSPCNEDPLTPHFYIVKQGFTGVYIIFLFLL